MTPSRTLPAPGVRAWDLGAAGISGADYSLVPPLVIVGLGNEIASDDGVGLHAAAALAVELRDRSDVEVVALPWAGFALLDVLRDRQRAVLIDGLTTDTHPPGAVVRLDEADFGGSVRLNSFHDINYPTVMALGRTLGWRMPDDVAIWGIEMAVFDEFGEGLTPVVADAVATVVHEVLAFLDRSNAVIDERPGVP
jgi:hydrogenase maturation protease